MNAAEYNIAKAKSCTEDAASRFTWDERTSPQGKAIADLSQAVHHIVLALEFMEGRYQANREEQSTPGR